MIREPCATASIRPVLQSVHKMGADGYECRPKSLTPDHRLEGQPRCVQSQTSLCAVCVDSVLVYVSYDTRSWSGVMLVRSTPHRRDELWHWRRLRHESG